MLPTGHDDDSRLDLIHTVDGPVSLQGLEAAQIGEAARVADPTRRVIGLASQPIGW